MSVKATAFHVGCIHPQTVDNFWVNIPGLLTSPLRVCETRLPFPIRDEYTISVGGQNVYLPGKTQVPGDWDCTVVESLTLDFLFNLRVLIKSQFVYESDSDSLLSTITSLIGKNQDPSDNMINFKFIEPVIYVTDSITKEVPIMKTILKGAWIKSIEPIQLDWSHPETPVKIKIRFRYQYIDSGVGI